MMNQPIEQKGHDNEDFHSSTEGIDRILAEMEAQKYVLRLFVADTTPKSRRAIEQLNQICEQHLQGRYELEIIDIYKHPELLEEEQIIAVPTLIKKLPPPLQKFIGDMANTEKLLVGLDIGPY